MTDVIIDRVGRPYGLVAALKSVSADITDREFVRLIELGCGKFTLLRVIAGLEIITAGTISIGEWVANDLPPKKQDISTVFQNCALDSHMTVAQNMEFSPNPIG